MLGLSASRLLLVVASLVFIVITAEASTVVELTESNFQQKVLESKQPWLVGFFAPWCGHCQRLAPDWNKAAESMKGIVSFGAINCDNEKNLAARFGIRGFPTIKVFSAGSKNGQTGDSVDYQGARTAAAIANYAALLVPDHVVSISNQKTMDAFQASSKPKVVLFTNKPSTPILFKSLAFEFLKVMDFGIVRSTASDVLKIHNVEKFPTVRVFQTDGNIQDFEGKIDKGKLGVFLASFVRASETNVDEIRKKVDPVRVRPEEEVAPDFTIVKTRDELRAASQKAESNKKVVALFVVYDNQQEDIHELSRRFRKDHIAFVVASRESDLAKLWNVDRGALPVDHSGAFAIVVKPKNRRAAFLPDIEDPSISILEKGYAQAYLDRVIGGDIKYITLRIVGEEKDWIDSLLGVSQAPKDEL